MVFLRSLRVFSVQTFSEISEILYMQLKFTNEMERSK